MRYLPLVNTLLVIGFLAVVAGTTFMLGWNGYNDNASHSLFVLHSVNGFLMLVRTVMKG